MATTAVRERVSMTAAASAEPPASRPVVIAVAGVVAAALGMLAAQAPVLLAWAFDARGTAGSLAALRAGLTAWLLALHGVVTVTGGHIGLAPLGLSLVVLALVARAGGQVVRRCAPDTMWRAAGLGAAVAIPHTVVVALITGPAGSAGARPAPIRTILAAAALATVAATLGALRAWGFARVADELPPSAVAVVRAALVGCAVLLAAGAVGAGLTIAWHHHRVGALFDSLHPHAGGWLPLLLLSVALVPNAAVYATSYALGTGFALGVGTSVAPSGVRLAALPAFPLLGGLPQPGPAPAVSLLLVVGPIVAGVLLGRVLSRERPDIGSGLAAGWALAAGAAAGVVLAALAWLAGGAAGPGQLATVGPHPFLTGLASAEWLGFVGAASAAWHARGRR